MQIINLLILLSYDFIFVISVIIRAVVKRAAQKLIHFIFVKVDIAAVAFGFIVINIVGTFFAVCNFQIKTPI